MVLSGKERQARYRQKLLDAASGADLGERARAAIDAGLAAVWEFYGRYPDLIGPEEYYSDIDAWRVHLAHEGKDAAAAQMREWMRATVEWEDDEAQPSDPERAAIITALAILDAATLQHVPAPPKPPKRTRKA